MPTVSPKPALDTGTQYAPLGSLWPQPSHVWTVVSVIQCTHWNMFYELNLGQEVKCFCDCPCILLSVHRDLSHGRMILSRISVRVTLCHCVGRQERRDLARPAMWQSDLRSVLCLVALAMATALFCSHSHSSPSKHIHAPTEHVQ